MDIKDIEKKAQKFNSKILFDYELKKTNWFNIGGKTKIFFKPETLQELIDFLKLYNERGKIFIIGAGSNIRDHVTIAKQTLLGMGSVVTKNIIKPGTYFGNPAKVYK